MAQSVLNIPIREATDQYRKTLALEGKAVSTQRVYMTVISRLADLFERQQRQARRVDYVSGLTPGVIDDLFAEYGSDHSRSTAMKALKHFFPWCVRRRYLTADDAAVLLDRKVTIPRKRPKVHLPISSFARALDIAGERHPRDRAIVALGLFTSYRESEISAITLGNVDLDGDIKVYRTKLKDYHSSPVGPDLREELDLWLPFYASEMGYDSPQAMIKAHPDWYLVPHITRKRRQNERGRFVTNEKDEFAILPRRESYRLELVVKRILTELGITGRSGVQRSHLGEGMHTLRRSSAEGMIQHLVEMDYDRGTATAMVSKRLGHSSIKTTEGYLDSDRVKREADDFARSNRLFGNLRPVPSNVVPLRGSRSDAEPTKAVSPASAPGSDAQAL